MSRLLPLCILDSILAQCKELCKKNAGKTWSPGNLVQVAKKRRSIFDIRRKRLRPLFRQAPEESTVSGIRNSEFGIRNSEFGIRNSEFGIRKKVMPARLFCQAKPKSFPAAPRPSAPHPVSLRTSPQAGAALRSSISIRRRSRHNNCSLFTIHYSFHHVPFPASIEPMHKSPFLSDSASIQAQVINFFVILLLKIMVIWANCRID